MRVFDFDRVLFDTDSFSDALNEHGLGDIPRGQKLIDAIDAAGIDWTSFVHTGVREYLSAHKDECAIVSSYVSRNRMDNIDSEEENFFQKVKIKKSGLAELVGEHLYITGESKSKELEMLAKGQSELLIVDDEMEHLRTAEMFGYIPIWFRTKKNLFMETKEGMPEHIEGGSVTSFEQFIALEESWKKKR